MNNIENSLTFSGVPDLAKVKSTITYTTWESHRNSLSPKYTIVWRDIFVVYFFLFGPTAILLWLDLGYSATIICSIFNILWVGFWLASLNLFMHEAAHYGIHSSRKKNDQLANWFISVWAAQDTSLYRSLHWKHHIHHGSTNDSEKSYFEKPTPTWIISFIFLKRQREVLKVRSQSPKNIANGHTINKAKLAYVRFIILITLLLGGFLLMGEHALAVSWIGGIFILFPIFGALRQIIEHRTPLSDENYNYSQGEHGPLNKIFSKSLFARSFGGAGFRLHGFHHWDPEISYTQLDSMEKFFSNSNLNNVIEKMRTSYFTEFLKITTKDLVTKTASPSCPICKQEKTHFEAFGWDSEYKSTNEKYPYYKCDQCSVLFIHTFPENSLSTIYPTNYYSYSKTKLGLIHKIKQRLDRKFLSRVLVERPGQKSSVLDIGGGTGRLLDQVKIISNGSSETVLLELDKSAIETAVKKGHLSIYGSVNDLNEENRFKNVFMMNVIEHIADPLKALKNIYLSLEHQGLAVLQTPNHDTLSYRIFRKWNWGGYHCPRHWILFDEDSIRHCAGLAGFTKVQIKYTQGAPQWTTSILGILSDLKIIKVTKKKPMYLHPFHGFFLFLTAAFDLFLARHFKTAQMLVFLEK